jgi:hypothetical protein
MDLVPSQSKFFPAKFFHCILEKEILARKNLLCKGGFSKILKSFQRKNIKVFTKFTEIESCRHHHQGTLHDQHLDLQHSLSVQK